MRFRNRTKNIQVYHMKDEKRIYVCLAKSLSEAKYLCEHMSWAKLTDFGKVISNGLLEIYDGTRWILCDGEANFSPVYAHTYKDGDTFSVGHRVTRKEMVA